MLLTILILLGYAPVLAAVVCEEGDKKVTIMVESEFRQRPLKSSSTHEKTITSHSTFRSSYDEYSKASENYDSDEGSASASGSYGAFSASVSAAFSTVSSSANSMAQASGSTTSEDTYSSTERTAKQEYFDDELQIVRDIKTTVTIDGVAASVEEQDIIFSTSKAGRYSYTQLQDLAKTYISERYGGATGGEISGNGNIFSQSRCYSTSSGWICSHYSDDDTAWRANNHATDKQMCERTRGRIFNGGDKSITPQCGGCHCCKPSTHEVTWTDWSNSNHEGHEIRHVCPPGYSVKRMTWKEESGHGLVDLEIDCGAGSPLRFTNNPNGLWNKNMDCSETWFVKIVGEEQGDYGIVNAKSSCYSSNDIQRSNSNNDGDDNRALFCMGNSVVVGLAVREQGGYGIVNIELACGYQGWICHHYSNDDTTWRANNNATDKQMCERTGGRKFNGGDTSITQQCGGCHCCKPTIG